MRLLSWERVAGWLLITLLALPLFWMAGYAVASSLGGVGLISAGWTLEHWQLAVSGSRLWRSLLLSGTLAVCSTTLGWLAALSLVTGSDRLRTDLRLQVLWCLPLAMPLAVQGFLGGVVLSRGGLLSRLCWWLGLTGSVQDFPVLIQDRYGIGLLLTMTAASIPLLVLFLTRTWMAVRIDDYLAVASGLGATRTFALRHVAIPMLWRRSRFMLLLTLLWNFNAWELPLLLGQQSPRMLSVLIQQSSGQFVLEERPQAFVNAVVYLCLAGLAVWRLSGYSGLDRSHNPESGDV